MEGLAESEEKVYLPIPAELYLALAARGVRGIPQVIESVVWDYIERTKENVPTQRESEEERYGHYWGGLFLPHGTELRVMYKGKPEIARVDGQKIYWERQKFDSVSQVAQAIRGGHPSNAWMHVEIREPTEFVWKRADDIRKRFKELGLSEG